MHSPHAAIAWQLWRPYRWWLAAGVAYFAAVAVACHLMPQGRIFDAVAWYLASPLGFGALGMLVVFSYGSGMDLGQRESGFPARMFTLPVSSRALAGWPMLYGTLALAAIWIAAVGLIIRPRGVDVPLLWPALFAAGFLAWFQVVCWLPFPLPWLRLPAAVAVLGLCTAVAAVGILEDVREPLMAAVFALPLPLAYGLAAAGVARARRGDSPDWLASWRPDESGHYERAARLGRRFASAGEAQAWFEWRLNGLILPRSAAAVLPMFVVIAIARYFENTSTTEAVRLAFFVCCTPLAMAAAIGPNLARLGRGPGGLLVPSYLATRPISTAGLVTAKLRMLVRSVAVAYLMTLAAAAMVVWLTGGFDPLAAAWRRLAQSQSAPKAAAMVLLCAVGLAAGTWTLTTAQMWLGLTGRKWFTTCYGFAFGAVFYGLLFAGWWIYMHPQLHAPLAAAAPWSLITAAAVKLLLAGWLLRVLVRRRLLEAAIARRLVAAWLAVAAGMLAVVSWLVPGELLAWHSAASAVVLAVPAVGIELAPLALAWNRHR